MAEKCHTFTTLVAVPFNFVYGKIKPYVNDIFFINNFSQFCYLFAITGIAAAGIFVVVPSLYSAEGYEGLCFVVQCIVAFLAFELQLNWVFMRNVSSAYIAEIHGTKPEGIPIGQNICKGDDSTNKPNGATKRSGKNKADTDKCVRTNNSSLMYVATEMPKTPNSPPTRTAYPYLSWTTCIFCQRPRPPRCHHCPICNVCVMKRDHHCFFTGTCIGVNNLRHFAVFLFWAVTATSFASFHAIPYAYTDIWPKISVVDVIFPVAILRSLLGYLEATLALLIVLYWLLGFFTIWCVSFSFECYSWIESGRTSFEITSKMVVVDTRNITGKIRAVFGEYWILNFAVPLHSVFKPIEDPLAWPFIRG